LSWQHPEPHWRSAAQQKALAKHALSTPRQHWPLQQGASDGQQLEPHCLKFGGSQHVVPSRQFAMLLQHVPPQRWSAVQHTLPKPHVSFAAQQVSPQTGPVLSAGHVMQTISSTSADACWHRCPTGHENAPHGSPAVQTFR
jgi:hypothetical protein